MNTVEDRLSAALNARAELVQPEDLRTASLPEAEPRHHLRPWTYAALAAACAAAIAVPITLSDGGDDAPPSGDEGLDWPLSDDRVDHDVDGDGRADHLSLRVREEGNRMGPARLDVQLSSGGALHRIFDYDANRWSLRDRVDLDGDGDHEIVVPRVAAADPEVGAEVLALVDGELVPAEVDDAAPFALAPDEQDHARDLWVDLNRSGLFSSRSIQPFERAAGGLVTPDSYQVEVWRWTLDDGLLTPQALSEPWCRERQTGQLPFPMPCGAGTVPSFMREVTRTIGVGEMVSLADPIPTLMLRRDGDQVVLDYSLSGRGFSAALPDRPGPVRAWAGMVNLGNSAVGPGFLVGWGQDPTVMAVYALNLGSDAARGRLGPVPLVADIPPLGTLVQADRTFHTFLAEDGTLYTRESVAPEDKQYRLWTWSMTGAGTLAATDLGIWCLDYVKATAGRC